MARDENFSFRDDFHLRGFSTWGRRSQIILFKDLTYSSYTALPPDLATYCGAVPRVGPDLWMENTPEQYNFLKIMK